MSDGGDLLENELDSLWPGPFHQKWREKNLEAKKDEEVQDKENKD